jgi:predicted transcriptional regulator
MATVPRSIRVDEDLVRVYDQLAEATGRPRNQLFVEALRQYAQTEGWQITEVRRTLADLDAGAIETIDGDEVVARLLATGRITRESLAEAEERYGIPPEHRAY